MSLYVLDTNCAIYYLKGQHPIIAEHLEEIHPDDRAITTISMAELYYGAWKSNKFSKNMQAASLLISSLTQLPFDERAALAHGEQRDRLRRAGTPIGPMDLLIAAIVLANDATLVTNNVREFSHVPGLRVENWILGPSA